MLKNFVSPSFLSPSSLQLTRFLLDEYLDLRGEREILLIELQTDDSPPPFFNKKSFYIFVIHFEIWH